ncbi:hypothetical protein JW905_12300 [bacterium]|nr:hypothetical protein [candidate division CSSED10-310 bacterium]
MNFSARNLKSLLQIAILVLAVLPLPRVVKMYSAARLAARGQSFLEVGNPARAIDDLQRAVGLRPSEGEYRFLLGKALGLGGLPDRGIVELEAATGYYNSFLLYEVLGQLYLGTGQIDRALAALTRGLCFARDNRELLLMQGQALLSLAVDLFNAAPSIPECPEEQLIPLGEMFLCERDLSQAESYLAGITPGIDQHLDGNRYCLAGAIRLLRGDAADALVHISTGLAADPFNRLGLLWGGRALVHLRHWNAALRLYECLLYSTDVLAEDALGYLLEELKMMLPELADEALRRYCSQLLVETALKAGVTAGVVDSGAATVMDLYLAGRLAAARGDSVGATALYRAALARQPDFIPAEAAQWQSGDRAVTRRVTRTLDLPVAVAPAIVPPVGSPAP